MQRQQWQAPVSPIITKPVSREIGDEHCSHAGDGGSNGPRYSTLNASAISCMSSWQDGHIHRPPLRHLLHLSEDFIVRPHSSHLPPAGADFGGPGRRPAARAAAFMRERLPIAPRRRCAYYPLRPMLTRRAALALTRGRQSSHRYSMPPPARLTTDTPHPPSLQHSHAA